MNWFEMLGMLVMWAVLLACFPRTIALVAITTLGITYWHLPIFIPDFTGCPGDILTCFIMVGGFISLICDFSFISWCASNW